MVRRRQTIEIYRGFTFAHEFTWKDARTNTVVDTSDYAAIFTVQNWDKTTTVLTATNATGEVILGGTSGTVTVVLAPARTTALTAALTYGGRYTLALTKGGHKTPVAEGYVAVLEVAGA